MPNLPPSNVLAGPTLNTLADVNSRVRSICNDNNGQLYPDGSIALLNACRNAYTWLYGQILRISGETFDKVITDIIYTAGTSGEEQDLLNILPLDMYYPIKLEFRLNSNETYQEIDRKTQLRSHNTDQLERPAEWEKRGHTIVVTSGQQSGLMKLRYRSLLPTLNLTTDPMQIQNAVEAIAHYAAAELFRARGQMTQMQSAMGDDGSRNGNVPFGAKGFAAMILDHIVMNDQEVPTRGARFSEGSADSISNRQYSG